MWETDLSDSDLITDEKADFLLAQVKEQLAGTIQDAEALTKTGIFLLGGLVTLASGLVGLASRSDALHPSAAVNWPLAVPLLVTAIYIAIDAVIIMWSALSMKGLDHPGNVPSSLATQSVLELELRLIKFAEALSYEGRIDANHLRNEAIGERINFGIKWACLGPFVYLTAFFIARFIFHP